MGAPGSYGNNERGFQLGLVASASAHEVAHAPKYKNLVFSAAIGAIRLQVFFVYLRERQELRYLAPVKQRLADQVVHDCPEPTLGPSCCLGSPPKGVIAAGQQVARISRAGQRRGMLSVVSCPCRLPTPATERYRRPGRSPHACARWDKAAQGGPTVANRRTTGS